MEPLDGVDVVDFTREVAGPHCTQLLAAFGADVVKVEPPDGDRTRTEWVDAFSSFNRGGKRSLSIDLKTEEGAAVVRDLTSEADVVVENFRPGVLDRYDLDYDSVAEHNPDVVYCSISGFGQSGPYRDRPAYDPIAQAMSGLLAATGYPDRPPVRIGASVIDCGTGVHAAFFVTAALLERRRTGHGRYIDTSLFDTAVSWMAYRIAACSRTGHVPDRTGSGNHVTDTVYRVGDDDMVYLKAETQAQFESLCRAIDRPDLLEDDRFVTDESRREHDRVLRAELATTFEEFDREELVARLTEVGVPVGPVVSVEALLTDPHVDAREMLTQTTLAEEDASTETASVPLWTDEGSVDFAGRPPGHGEHNREVLKDLGYDDEAVDNLVESGVLAGSGR